ncbi:MAG: signal peptidase I [Deltaproteobacteria bacterium]|nr:signal peptidase I [Deltaproteobacteria bacterium]
MRTRNGLAVERATDEKKSKEGEETRRERIISNIKTIGGAVLLALLIRTVLFEAFEIEGPSMEPTLLNGDRVVVAKYYYGLFLPFQRESILNWGQPKPGDVVIIKSPADNVDIVKRVVGLPGDIIEIRQDEILRNHKPMGLKDIGPCVEGRGKYRAPQCRVRLSRIDDKEYRTSGVPLFQTRLPIRVPEGHVYVLGDHRDSSNDSRSIGMIPFNRLKGKALAIYWSNDRDGFRWSRIFQSVQ